MIRKSEYAVVSFKALTNRHIGFAFSLGGSAMKRRERALEMMAEAGVDQSYVKHLDAIDYIQAKSQIVSQMEACWRLAFYMAHFYEEFDTIVLNQE